MRHYSKLLGLRAWGIVRRPIWAIVVIVGAVYTFLQVVARVQAERLVKMFDALHEWDPFYEWWYVPLTVIVLGVLLKAGYELWNESEEGRKKAQGQLRVSEEERKKLEGELETARAKTDNTLGYEKLVAELERVRGERDKFERELTTYKRNEPFRDRRLKNEAKWEYLREANLSEIKELKQRCLELADELYRFLEERGHKEMDNLQDPEVQRRSDETVEQYRQRFMDVVNGLREDLEQYDLWGLGVIDPYERDLVDNPTNYHNVRAIAEFLSSIGNRL